MVIKNLFQQVKTDKVGNQLASLFTVHLRKFAALVQSEQGIVSEKIQYGLFLFCLCYDYIFFLIIVQRFLQVTGSGQNVFVFNAYIGPGFVLLI